MSAPTPRPADDLRRGALCMVLSALLFAAMGAAVKIAAKQLDNPMVVFFRSASGLLVLVPWAAAGGFRSLRTAHLREHLVRSLMGTGAMYAFFYAIAHMRLADAVLINYSLPLLLPFVERAWLGEDLPRGIWGPILLGFLGLLLILKPGMGVFQPAALVALLAATFAATAQVGVRRLTLTEPAMRIVFYFAVISTALSVVPALGAWTSPPRSLWGVLAAMGVLASAAQWLLTRAYAQAPASRVGPFIYTAVVFAALFDWLLWRALPDLFSVAGTIAVVAAGVLALRGRVGPRPAAPGPEAPV